MEKTFESAFNIRENSYLEFDYVDNYLKYMDSHGKDF